MISNTQELQQHIRLISQNDFDNIRPSLKRAERYVSRVTGQRTWEAALAHYRSTDYGNVHTQGYQPKDETSGLMDQLVDRIQDPLVHYAYYLWSPQANVILSDSGYQVVWSESMRPAQEWQIRKAEQSLLDTAHEFMDDLVEFLDRHIDAFEFWGGSEEQASSHELLIRSAREFSLQIPINDSRRLFIELKPHIQRSEHSYILPVIGRERFDLLKERQKDGELTPEDETLLGFIRPPLAHMALWHASAMLPVDILPGNLTGGDSMTASKKNQPAHTQLLNTFAAHLKTTGEELLKQLSLFVEALHAVPPTESTGKTIIVTDKSFSL